MQYRVILPIDRNYGVADRKAAWPLFRRSSASASFFASSSIEGLEAAEPGVLQALQYEG